MKSAIPATVPPSAGLAAPPVGSPPGEKDLRLKYRAGTPCLYLVETLGEWTGRRFERIRNGKLWQDWLSHVGLPQPDRPATEEDLARMRGLRAAIFAVVQAARRGKTPPEQDLECVNYWAGCPPPAVALDRDATGLAVRPGITQQQILSLVARDAVALLSGPLRGRIRECASATCPVLFVDRSRRGDRVWCSPTCGARLATARYRRRHAVTTPADGREKS